MFRKLHIQLTALCAATTGAVLAILTVLCLFISESDIRNQESTSFSANLEALYQNMAQQATLSHTWLRQMEHSYQIRLQIMDSGVPLFFEKLSGYDETVQELMEQTARTALEDYRIDLRQTTSAGILTRHAEFTLKDDSGAYWYSSAALLPRSGNCIAVAVLHPLTRMNERILQQRLLFVLADLAAWAVLTLFFWFFTARMLQPLRENRRRQTQFIAAASHELRSPLTVILSNIAAVRSGIMRPDEQFLEAVDSESKRMSRLVGDMLQLAAADNHSWTMQPEEIELDTLCLQVWENYEPLAAARGLLWKIDLPDDAVPHCVCDAERIRQLLSILIDNAFSYTPEGGCVRLSLAAASGAFRLSVADNGPGIPDESKRTVFERFHRLDSARKSKSHFGLGLSIAQEIARLHHGQITLLDTPGGGATFTVTLPAASSGKNPNR